MAAVTNQKRETGSSREVFGDLSYIGTISLAGEVKSILARAKGVNALWGCKVNVRPFCGI